MYDVNDQVDLKDKRLINGIITHKNMTISPRTGIVMTLGVQWPMGISGMYDSRDLMPSKGVNSLKSHVITIKIGPTCECGAIVAKSGHADWCECSPHYVAKAKRDCNCALGMSFDGGLHMPYCVSQSPG